MYDISTVALCRLHSCFDSHHSSTCTVLLSNTVMVCRSDASALPFDEVKEQNYPLAELIAFVNDAIPLLKLAREDREKQEEEDRIRKEKEEEKARKKAEKEAAKAAKEAEKAAKDAAKKASGKKSKKKKDDDEEEEPAEEEKEQSEASEHEDKAESEAEAEEEAAEDEEEADE